MKESARLKDSGGETPVFPKSPTGIEGLDEITGGGLPEGRPTLVCGKAGCGKTLFGVQFLVNGAVKYGEPGVFISFEERVPDLAKNVRSLGYDLLDLQKEKLVALDHVVVDRGTIEETGEYDLEGLFIRLGMAVESIGAKRVVLDTIESLFSGLQNEGVLRSELVRLFSWIKEKELTAVVTGESGDGMFTRHGLEEYVSDCVIFLDHRVDHQVSTRRLRVVKYRGSTHGTNEYPFLIGEDGISVLPITSLGLHHEALRDRVSTGVERLDAMLGGKGYYRGSSVLISGSAGSGKTSLAAAFANACCRRGEKCLYFAFEESPDQIVRNMQSIGIDLSPHLASGLLNIHAARPALYGLEMHLALMLKMIRDYSPSAVIVDPISNLQAVGTTDDSKAMITRIIDSIKVNHITSVMTELEYEQGMRGSSTRISSLIDTWLMLADIEEPGERNKGLYVLKSRGMAHSNQIRELILSDKGISLSDVYLGPGSLLTGTSRFLQEAKDREERRQKEEELRTRKLQIENRVKALNAQIESLNAEAEAGRSELSRLAEREKEQKGVDLEERQQVADRRKADPGENSRDMEKKVHHDEF
ncbi:circadian clock protein KaiC [Methanolinea mesophila]|uniref:circadian clock protein KaiC n=1 Tax=Methanolinea mesophila TaxID=547055 RepID=UPI001AEA6F1A|nr:circadian clock protein KaiC [Methanolinea mesophila]MBP1927696.1 circadian clock protein KaiC [Methanolinea mesophila]